MGHAIANTFKSITGSSITTVAGFAALCMMTFALGKNLGIVMSKGVIIGVLCCVTLLPAMILIFDKPIEKTRHKSLFKTEKVDKVSAFITKHYKIWLQFSVLCCCRLSMETIIPVFTTTSRSLFRRIWIPTSPNEKLSEDFDMSVMHIIMMDKTWMVQKKQDAR